MAAMQPESCANVNRETDMNDRHNRIAGCQAAVDAALAQVEIAARRLADAIIALEDNPQSVRGGVFELARPYRKAQESYATALEDLADALRR